MLIATDDLRPRRTPAWLPGLAALALASCAGSPDRPPAAAGEAAPPPPRFVVESNLGPQDGSIRSLLKPQEGGEIPHGLQVATERGWLREAWVYEQGVLMRHTYFHRDGYPFIESHKDAAGDGIVYITNAREVIVEPHGSMRNIVFTGHARAGKRWNGPFLVVEIVPHTYGQQQFMLHEYREGELVRREPFPFDRVGVEPPNNAVNPTNWPWPPLEWPAPQRMMAPE